jgi:ABC-type dipeptide/oligopeptide/nickel transport system permease component
LGRYVARRLLQLIPVFIGATVILYAAVYILPGDPIRALFGDRPVSPGTVQALRERYNLNDPFHVQYAKYLFGIFQGDFGENFRGRAVTTLLSERIPVTLRLAGFAFAIEIVVGLIAGVFAGLKRGSFLDNLVRITTIMLVAIPVFVLGYALQYYLGVQADILPISGNREGFISYLMPGYVLAASSLGVIARLTRTSLVENLRADYVRTATAKGLKRSRVVGRHTLRNSLIPVVTYLGIDLGSLMLGAVITEGVFNIPGIGRLVFQSISQQENTVVVGTVTILVIVFLVSNLIVDMLYAFLDPRIRYE